ncbi:Subunit of heteropentameric Replication factor C (RF-C) [Oleoguttula sp. CCFEE 5521]
MRPSSKGTVYSRVSTLVEDLVAEGWSAGQLVTQLYEAIVIEDESVADWQKARIVLAFSETDKRQYFADVAGVISGKRRRSGGACDGNGNEAGEVPGEGWYRVVELLDGGF